MTNGSPTVEVGSADRKPYLQCWASSRLRHRPADKAILVTFPHFQEHQARGILHKQDRLSSGIPRIYVPTNDPTMKITQLYIFPIKSLRGISLSAATICAQGLAYDRRYILLRLNANGTYKSMFVGQLPEMALYHCKLSSHDQPWTHFTVENHSPNAPSSNQMNSIDIPFSPDIKPLDQVHIKIHTDPNYPAYLMPKNFNTWFSESFGYPVVLAYLGDGLGIKRNDEKAQSWLPTIRPIIPKADSAINFSDGAALLLASESSLEDLHPRIGGEKAVLEKFRPNIVVDGEGTAWDEDFWGEVKIVRTGLTIVLTANCARCTSINVDLDKGKMAEGESGKLLKKMMKDRRVDKGNKWEPIFGRYGFPTYGGEINVGDDVVVSRRNQERTVWNGVMPRLTQVEQISV